ncbi:ATP-binding cassette domain-containing protein [Micromonospora sp. CA-263727]|uniref:ATP-binding cassette domain-containing protein n=1 Tax=Micromonospora sp. CA-263727 TaxID=3239967 RepID=UPI003D8A3172
MSVSRLVCEELSKTYGGGFRLGPLTMEISVGVTCLVGANGAGKSTFFRLAAKVDKPTSGTVRLDSGVNRAALGYLPQEPTLPPAATCEDFLVYVAWLQGIPAAARGRAVSSALSRVGLTDQRASRVRSLSGGMRRRLGIAHAIVHDPALLLLDEPTAGLDPRQRIGLRETIANLGGDQVVIVSTHLVEDIRGLASRVIVLSEGTVVFDGDVAGLERLATPDAPGDTDLERSIASLMEASG